MACKKKSKLSGAIRVAQWSKGVCFKEFRGRAPLIEICMEAVKDATDLVATGKALYFSDAVDQVSKGCVKMPFNNQVACITGATEVLLRSKNQTASLEGRKVGWARGVGSSIPTKEMRVSRLEVRRHEADLIYWKDDKYVGYVAVKPKKRDLGIYIVPEMRSKGYGAKLLTDAVCRTGYRFFTPGTTKGRALARKVGAVKVRKSVAYKGLYEHRLPACPEMKKLARRRR
jgi:hypothetical protein